MVTRPASRIPHAQAVENAMASTRPRCIATRMSTPRPSPACASAVSTRYPRVASCMRMSYTPFQTTKATANHRMRSRRLTVRIPQHQRGDVVALRGAFREHPNVGEDCLQELGRGEIDVLLGDRHDPCLAV